MKNTGRSVLINFLWRLMERSGAQLVALAVSVILARKLSPDDFGTVALISVFINILAVFIDGGLATALIQKKDADDLDFSSVFYAQLFLCCLFYLILYYSAPMISKYFNKPEMNSMLRVLGLTLVIAGIKNVQTAYVSRHMEFKKFFFATLIGTIGAAILGIWLAFAGFGVWALVVQSLFNNTIDTIVLWIIVRWRPQKLFSFKRLHELFSFSWKLLVSSLLDTGYNNLSSLIIGKVYTPADLAFFDQGKKWPNLIISNINTSIDSVLLPSMSSEQGNKDKLKAMTRRAIKVSTFIMAPIFMILAISGEQIIRVLLTEKWLPAVPFLILSCVTSFLHPIHSANLNALKATGRSDLFLKLEIVKKIIGVILLVVSIPIGVKAIAYSLLIGNILYLFINSWPNKRILGYGFFEQMKDIFPSVVRALIMGVCIYWLAYLPVNKLYILALQVITGTSIYIAESRIIRAESYQYICGIVENVFGKKRSA